ncbi:MAG: nucleoside-diphosphate kinase [Bacteroidetes bacterium]|nr:nucleoside-diphosphate kinase [Bacteroidota bacterium]
MIGNKTFAIIKPSAVKDNHIGEITAMIEKKGFRVNAMKLTKMSFDDASKFYNVHKDKPFYNDLCKYMSAGPIMPLILSKENAVKSFRNLIGATNPAEAQEGTIRHKFGKSIDENAIHGSDSDENAANEMDFFFTKNEIF